jgi:hypothetical protein
LQLDTSTLSIATRPRELRKKCVYASSAARHDHAVTAPRSWLALCALTLVALPASALEPDEPAERPDAPDLLGGNWLFTVGGGVWTPSSGLLPTIPELGEVPVAGVVHAHLGVGLNRYLVLNIADGGFAHGPGDSGLCAGCGLYSIDVGPSLVFRPTQGFALDPWVSYGAGYRHNILILDSGNERVLGVDVAKLALGADWYPVSLFGFGPYIATDIGLRTSGKVAGYAIFHTGLRMTFDPMRAGTTISPVTASR